MTTPSLGSSRAEPIGPQLWKAKRWAKGRLVIRKGRYLYWTEDTFPFSRHFLENPSSHDVGYPVFFSVAGIALSEKQRRYFQRLDPRVQKSLMYSHETAVERIVEAYRAGQANLVKAPG